jgi:hypothetical protein
MSDNQSSSSSVPLDFDTPDGICISYSDTRFSDGQLQTLNERENFAKSLLQIINDLRQKGWTDFDIILNFPRPELLKMLGLSKKSKVLRGLELHE